MRLERRTGRSVALACNPQPNISASRRNAAVWRNRQRPSSSAGLGGNGAGLGEARQGDQSERLSLARVIGLPLGDGPLC